MTVPILQQLVQFAVERFSEACARSSPYPFMAGEIGQLEGTDVSGRVSLLPLDEASAFVLGQLGRSFLAGVSLCIALVAAAGPVRAADLPSKPEPPDYQPPPPAEFSWNGFYAGVHVGGGVDHFGFPFAIEVPGTGGFVSGTTGITASGPVGGLQAGFNYELPFFHIVAGIEIDNTASGIRGQTTVNRTFPSGAPFTATFGSKFENFGTARLRLGYAWGRFLPYLTAGFTYGIIETYYSVFTPGFFSAAASTATRSGVFPHVGVAGIGLEYAITPNFTAKVEYMYEFINARRVIFTPVAGTSIQFGTRTMYHIARVGLNYKFDWLSPLPAPIAANY